MLPLRINNLPPWDCWQLIPTPCGWCPSKRHPSGGSKTSGHLGRSCIQRSGYTRGFREAIRFNEAKPDFLKACGFPAGDIHTAVECIWMVDDFDPETRQIDLQYINRQSAGKKKRKRSTKHPVPKKIWQVIFAILIFTKSSKIHRFHVAPFRLGFRTHPSVGLLLLCSRYSLQALLLARPMQDSKSWKVPPSKRCFVMSIKKQLSFRFRCSMTLQNTQYILFWSIASRIGLCSYYHRTSCVCFRFAGHASSFPMPTLHQNTSSFCSSLLKSELGMRAAGHSIKLKRQVLLELDLKVRRLVKSTWTRTRPPSTVCGFASSTLLERASGLLPWLSE